MAKYTIDFSTLFQGQIQQIRAFDRRQILQKIEEQLHFQPFLPTRNRKILIGAVARFEHEPPIWELRIGQFRVYYDIDDDRGIVHVRAMREKRPTHTTEQLLDESDDI